MALGSHGNLIHEFLGAIVGLRDQAHKGDDMPAETHTFHYEIEKSGDATTGRVTRVICHGHLVNQTADQLKDVVKPLIPIGGKIILDFKEVGFVDSLGLGTLVGLKVSAIGAGYCSLEFEHLSPRVQELLRLTNLMQLFKS
jgi:anti-anti-sigma factor